MERASAQQMKTFCNLVRKLKAEYGWTKEAIGRMVGVKHNTISEWVLKGRCMLKSDYPGRLAKLQGILDEKKVYSNDRKRQRDSISDEEVREVLEEVAKVRTEFGLPVGWKYGHALALLETGKSYIRKTTRDKLLQVLRDYAEDCRRTGRVRGSYYVSREYAEPLLKRMRDYYRANSMSVHAMAGYLGMTDCALYRWMFETHKNISRVLYEKVAANMDRLEASDYGNTHKAYLVPAKEAEALLERVRKQSKRMPKVAIGRILGISENTIYSWCYNTPRRISRPLYEKAMRGMETLETKGNKS